jgi:hypothetical protein
LHLDKNPLAMKKLTIILFALISMSAAGQSESFQTLRDKFAHEADVHCFKVSGTLCRAVLWIAGEGELKDAIDEISAIRVITIPKDRFKEHDLSIKGFKRFIAKDHFESLAQVRDQGERLEVYLQESGNHENRYLVLAEESNEVTVIEIRGYIDIQKIRDLEKRKNSYQNL